MRVIKQPFDLGRAATVIDPTQEDLRSMISAAKAATDAGLVTICAFPSYRRTDRAEIRDRIGEERVFEVYVNTDRALCRERRPNASFEGFEAPEQADLTFDLASGRFRESLKRIIDGLENAGQFERPSA